MKKPLFFLLLLSCAVLDAVTFTGSVPTRPGDVPSSASLLLMEAKIMGPSGMTTGESYTYFLQGKYFNTQTGKVSVHAITGVTWTVSEKGSAPEGITVAAEGLVTVAHVASAVYPRTVTLTATTPVSGSTVTSTHTLTVTHTP